jgi:hypothetical protein
VGLILLPGIFGTLGALLRSVGKTMWKGRVSGLDEKGRKTSSVVLLLAGFLFVPLWLLALGLTYDALSPKESMDPLAACAACAAFSSALVLGIVREWRRVPAVKMTP